MMVKKLLMAVFLVMGMLAAKAGDSQKIVSKVQKVIVFLNGAQVTRTATVNVTAGTSELVFGGVSPEIEAQSIQVHADGEFTILSVKHEFNYLNEQGKTRQLADLQAAQKAVKDKIDLQNNLLSIYLNEENILMKNQVVKADNASLDVLKLKEALDFQTQRLGLIKEKELGLKNQVAILNLEYDKYNRQIETINQTINIRTSNIIVAISSKAALQTTFTITYVTHAASWYPSYDIKAKNINSPLTIAYKANVSQNSGEEWDNVKLTLSTGNPAINGTKPDMRPYYLDYSVVDILASPSLNTVQYKTDNNLSNMLTGSVGGLDVKRNVTVFGYATASNNVTNSIPVDVSAIENQTNVEFAIENPYTVQSDGKNCLVEINQVEVTATYQYYAAPKVNTNVFLTAKVTDWNKYNFLSGEANLFFEGTYLGKSKIDTHLLNDTLNLSLGIDKGIIVKRIVKQDLSERQTLGSNKKETKDWLIEIKNRKNQSIDLLVEDQVPVSQNSDIVVETQELSGAKLDATTGKVSWNLNLKPLDDKKLELKYQVKYPKNQTVIVQ